MANRFTNPNVWYPDASGNPLAGGLLFFYVTGTSTKAETFSDEELSTANANPVVLDSAGRAGDIFLDPSVTYKVVLAPATDTDPPTAPIWTADPVVDLAANVTAAFAVYAGDPNGNVAGTAGTVGGAGASAIYDITNNILFVCVTTGDADNAVWQAVAAGLSGNEDIRTTDHTVSADDNGRIQTANKASAITFNLTAAATLGAGFLVGIKNIGAGTLTIDPAGAETIDTASTIALAQYDGVILYCTGTTWRVLAREGVKDATVTPAKLTTAAKTEAFTVAASDEGTALTTGTAKVTWRMPYAFTVTEVRASLTTAQSSGNIFTVDINESGTSILSTKLTIDNTSKTSVGATTPPVISDASLADDAEMTVDIDQIGDGTATGLKVTLIGYPT